MRFLELVVDTTANSLGNLGEKVPNLQQIKLNGSNIPTIRDLGTSLRGIQVLWISRCGITELDGIGALPNMRELYASYNDIDDVCPLSNLEKIQIIDLEGNKIEDITQMHFLADCLALRSLTLEGNAIAQMPNYRFDIASTLNQLEFLDDVPISNDERLSVRFTILTFCDKPHLHSTTTTTTTRMIMEISHQMYSMTRRNYFKVIESLRYSRIRSNMPRLKQKRTD